MRITSYRTELNDDSLTVLVKENAVNYTCLNDISNPESVTKVMCDVFGLHLRAEEYMFQIALNNKNKPLAVFEVFHGTVNNCCANVREVMIRNYLVGASSFLLIHNHPSGEVIPSNADVEITRRIKAAGELMGIELLDHIIVGSNIEQIGMNNNYYSLREHEFM